MRLVDYKRRRYIALLLSLLRAIITLGSSDDNNTWLGNSNTHNNAIIMRLITSGLIISGLGMFLLLKLTRCPVLLTSGR